jgi:hypothetical protein
VITCAIRYRPRKISAYETEPAEITDWRAM